MGMCILIRHPSAGRGNLPHLTRCARQEHGDTWQQVQAGLPAAIHRAADGSPGAVAIVHCQIAGERVIAPRTFFWRSLGRELSPSLSFLSLALPAFCRHGGCTEAQFEEWLAAWRQAPEGRRWGTKATAAAAAAAEPQRQ